MLKKFFIIIIPLVLLLATCVKPYYPDIDKYDKIVVIDGLLADDGTPPVVILSYSYKTDKHFSDPISDASVYITSSDGSRYDLAETVDGKYTYTQDMFQVKVGMSFQLVVEHDGNVFSSTLETVMPVAPVTTLSMAPIDNSESNSISILLSSVGTDEQSKYYSWQCEETWKFRVPLISPKLINKEVCYAKQQTKGIIIGSTESFSNNSFDLFHVLSVPFDSPKLSIRYSVLAKQYSITRECYLYLQHIQKINESNGSLFDPVPASMNGNVASENSPVIGNFQVSSVSQYRLFIDRSDLPKNAIISQGLEDCTMESATLGDTRMKDSLIGAKMILMDTAIIQTTTFLRFASAITCFDCTASGAPNTPPSWWTEKE